FFFCSCQGLRKLAIHPIWLRLSTQKVLTWVPITCHLRKLSGFVEEKSDSRALFTVESFNLCLQSCTDIRSLRELHARILTQGLGDSIYLGSKLLNYYANFGALPESRLVFGKIINRNLSLWNSAIVGYFRADFADEALWLYTRLKSERIGFDSSTVTFCLKSCIKLRNIHFGRGLHVDALKVSLSKDNFVGSSLVGLYSRLGSINDAQKAFEEILDKDIVSYTAMVTGYAQYSDAFARMAFETTSDMQRKGLGANRVTLVSLLQAAGHLEALREGQSIHCYSIRRGIDILDEVLQTSIVNMYARCGANDLAASMLKQTRGTVASWNAMIAGLVHCGQSSLAIKYFSLMQQEVNIFPDSVTFANLLSACSDLPCAHHVASIHGYLVRRNIPLDVVLTTTLIEMYSKCNKSKRSRQLFDQLTIRDIVLYNVMISSYLQNGLADEAIKLLVKMTIIGVAPNSITLLSLLSAFANLTDIRKGRFVHGLVIRGGFQSNVDISNQIIHMYATCGKLDTARTIFNSITEKDLVSWTTMMMGCVTSGHADEALVVYQLMQQAGKRADSVTITTLLQALSQLGCLELVKEVHSYIYRTLSENDSATMNCVIMTYARCGRLDLSEVVFSSMGEKLLATWNTMIAAYGVHGCSNKVLELFKQLQKENLKPDELTFSSVLSACSHAGLVEDGLQIFHSMSSEYSIAPREEHYGCIVDLLGRAGRLEEAYNFVKCSPLNNKASALCALLAACGTHRNAELGEVVGRQLQELEPQNSGTYALASNVYAQGGKWSEAADLRIVAKQRGLRKLPGYSLV
ncbi:pentatricopeptide repeat-containing protein At4g21300-like, partial [Typha angustifolia]|uniref:pentatricopeptide repeat-containing protein At4g21300-like n=1 Tax=Typha angustifolia TaxID=59011 RepID=UPI003C2D2450